MKRWITPALTTIGLLVLGTAPATALDIRPGQVGVHAQTHIATACFSCEPDVVPPPEGALVHGVGGVATAESGLLPGGGDPPSGSGEGGSAGARAFVDEPTGSLSVRVAATAAGVSNGHANATAVIDDTITLSTAATVVLEGSVTGNISASFDRDASVGARLFFHGPFSPPTPDCECEGWHFPRLGGYRGDWAAGEQLSGSFSVSVDLPAGTSSFNAKLIGFADALSDLGGSAGSSASAEIAFRIVLPDGVSAFSGSGLLPIMGSVPPPNTPAGSDVSVGLPHGVSLHFDTVTASGNSSVVKTESAPPLSATFSLADPPTFYDISTNAAFGGSILVCVDTTGVSFSGPPALLHYENGDWVDSTVQPAMLPTLCGRVTSLSPFALGVSELPPPTTPGVPHANRTATQGTFTLRWEASQFAGSEAYYIVEHKPASGGFAHFSYALNDVLEIGTPFLFEMQGTWVYRVQARDFDGHLVRFSAFSGESEPIKVDWTPPHPPLLATDRLANDGWYRDSVTVSFSDAGDPLLPDGSAGSGVDPASIPAPVVRSVSGQSLVSGTVEDRAGNESAEATLEIRVDADNPTVSIDCPAVVIAGSTATANWTAFDGQSGLATEPAGTVALDTSVVGTGQAVSPVARDKVGHESTESCTYRVVYDFAGFFSPVDGLPTLNSVNAGKAIPVKFSLGGNRGLNIFEAGYPRSQAIACDSSAAVDGIEETLTAGASSLAYDAATGRYLYVWKTERGWVGTCRQLVVKLADGTYHRANFKFT